ncbi:nanos homolog 2-like [Maniola hyperantus]|uniref:nanos homolog 2-like n=1 Tax=Aphantopus hyperantus TaxID=2795564 RepID=UPI00212D29D9
MITITDNQATMCRFCKNNGEDEKKYSSHTLKDGSGRVLCPVLRAFRCVRCGATGDRAHTIKYCPMKENGIDRALLLRLGRCVSSLDAFMYNDDNDGSAAVSEHRPTHRHRSLPLLLHSTNPFSAPASLK